MNLIHHIRQRFQTFGQHLGLVPDDQGGREEQSGHHHLFGGLLRSLNVRPRNTTIGTTRRPSSHHQDHQPPPAGSSRLAATGGGGVCWALAATSAVALPVYGDGAWTVTFHSPGDRTGPLL